MPSLEEWFNIVATCLDAMFLEAPVTMNIAKTAGYRDMVGAGSALGFRSEGTGRCLGETTWGHLYIFAYIGQGENTEHRYGRNTLCTVS